VTSGIVGRETELAALRDFVERDVEGPHALVLEGEPGIGKSTLWLAGVALARARGYRVLVSRPAEAEAGLAFAGLGDLFEHALGDVVPMLSAPRRKALEAALLLDDAEPHVDPRALGVAVRNGLEILAGQTPVLVAIDDVQWLDRSSGSALTFASRRLRDPVLFLLARRRVEGSEPSYLEQALPPGSVMQLPVGPLSVGAVQLVLRERFERVFSRPTLLRLHEASGGNPFYALELARALDGDVDPDPTQPLPVPGTLEGLVEARLAGLPRATREALSLAAALGAPPAELLRAAGVEEASLAPAIGAGVVEWTAGSLRFTHPLLSSGLYQGVGAGERRRIHGRLAEVVEEPLARARHRALATERPNADVATVLEGEAAAAAVRGAPLVAVELGEHALRLTPPEAKTDLQRRTIALARAHWATASVDRARALAARAVDRAPAGPSRAEALVLASEVAPDLREHTRLLREAADAAPDRSALRVAILERLGWDIRFTEGMASAEEYAREGLAISEELGDEAVRAGALALYSTTRFHLGEPDAVLLAERAYELARATTDPERLADITLTVSSTFIWAGHYERARNLLVPLYHDWSERDEAIAGQIAWRLACVALAEGRLPDAEERVRQALAVNEEYGGHDPATTWAAAQVAALRGELDRAEELVVWYRQAHELRPWFVPHHETVLGVVAALRGDPRLAADHFAAAERARRAIGSSEPNLARWRADYVEVLLELGRIDDALAVLDPWEADAVRLGREPVLAQALRCRGLVAAARGDVALAGALLEKAAERHAAVGDRLGAARARLALGAVLRRSRQKRAAREAIEEAIRGFEECGAPPFVDKARAELGRLGGRRREEGLTSAEKRVAALVARGRTNSEVAAELFLGVRTVETHLSHIYVKLGVRSRTELSRVYDRHV